MWGFTRKYRLRIYFGILCGMLTAGTLLPLFQVIQPALDKVGSADKVENVQDVWKFALTDELVDNPIVFKIEEEKK